MSKDIPYKEFIKAEFKINRYRWPIVLWTILLTTGLILTTKKLSSLDIIQSILLTGIVCFFSFVDLRYFSNKNFNILPDIIKIGCIILLVLIFGYWGLVYTSLFLIILIIDAFSFSARDFMIVSLMVVTALVSIWWFQSDPIYGSSLIKNTFFLVITSLIFALGMLLRILARESLNILGREKELEESQVRLQEENDEMIAVFNNMENAIFSLDSNNNVYFVNKSAITTFPGLKGKDLTKIDIDQLSLTDSTGKQVTFREIVNAPDEKIYRSDLTTTVAGKTTSFNLLVTKIYNNEKKYDGAMISLHSLTSDEMLEKNRMEFVSLASHEIRTPLTVLEGYLSLMLSNEGFVYNDMTKEYLTTLHDTTTDLIKLSNTILSMSKIDEGSVRVDIEKTNLANLIKDTTAGLLKLAKSKKLNIKNDISPVPTIETDKSKIGEILRNLIENAIKFSDKGDITVTLDQEGDEVIISVEDSGIGVPEASRDKIFSKFYQVENWDTRKNSGTGLGLYVSKSLAKRIGGDLILETTSKKGAKFSLILPVKYPNLDDLKKHKDRKLKEFIEGF